jgi:hypothetical protein
MSRCIVPITVGLTNAEIVVFPVKHRIGKIRRTAALLSTRHGRAAASYWQQVVIRMVGQMAVAGVDDAVIRLEIEAFHKAVQAELQIAPRVHGGGGDAV